MSRLQVVRIRIEGGLSMRSCKEISRLVSEGLDRKLSFWERLSIRIHHLICGPCEAYEHQIHFLRQVFLSLGGKEDLEIEGAPSLDGEAKKRLKAALRDHARP